MELAVQRINGHDIINWFQSGSHEVLRSKRRLNAINVFPVADGDTGTNLATTLRAMVDRPTRELSFSSMLQGLSDSGLTHARGNSGIIFASYVSGIAAEGATYDTVNAEEFAQIAARAVAHVYRAVDNPVEGTMLSVIREWAAALSRAALRHHGFREMLADAYEAAGVALQKTSDQLEVLRRNHVVDAGAEGFVRFLEGINRFFSGEVASAEPEQTPDFQIAHGEDDASSHRYCTEILVRTLDRTSRAGDTEVEDSLKKLLSPLGDSLIVSALGGKTRVHIHTDAPALVVEAVKPYGSILEQKVDDMRLQASVRDHRKHAVGILTDSIADLPADFVLENQIHTLPMGLLLDGTVYLDKVTIQPGQLSEAIARSEVYPTSSLPEPGRIRSVLESLIETYDSLICISVSSAMSGTYGVISRELESIDRLGKQVTVIDSLTNSGAEGLLVKEAADALNEGASHDEVIARIEALVPRARIYVCLETLEYAVRSGRVPNTVGRIGIKLGLRPIMSVDARGKGTAFGAAFSRAGITKKINRLVRKQMQTGGIRSYAIVHVDNPELADQYRTQLTLMTGREPEFVTEVSSVIAIHSGPGSVAVCLIESQEATHA